MDSKEEIKKEEEIISDAAESLASIFVSLFDQQFERKNKDSQITN
ncbi:MAG: hypothetical protein WAV11_03295 [Minisyncoccia bacterium]